MGDHVKVAIIGGGWSGMAAAVELAARNIPVTVYEAGVLVGGRARRVEVNGVALDNGLHIMIGAYRETLRLIEKVNPNHQNDIAHFPLTWNIKDGKLQNTFELKAANLPAPLHLVVGILRAHGITWRERLSLAQFLNALKKIRFKLETDITVAQLLADQSENLRRVLWYPLCIAALNTPPEIASAQIFLNVLRDTLAADRAASDLILARTDLSAVFPEPALRWVEARGGIVKTSTRVTAIETQNAGFAVTAGGNVETYTHVICALPPHQVNAFLVGITALSEVVETIEQLEYQPIHSVWLQYDESIKLPEPMLGFADGIAQWVFDREALCGQRGLIGVVISASGDHLHLPQEQLALAVQQELEQKLGITQTPAWTRVIAEKRATFSCKASANSGTARPQSKTPLKNFYLAGDYIESDYPATLESAVRSGIRCAARISEGTA